MFNSTLQSKDAETSALLAECEQLRVLVSLGSTQRQVTTADFQGQARPQGTDASCQANFAAIGRATCDVGTSVDSKSSHCTVGVQTESDSDDLALYSTLSSRQPFVGIRFLTAWETFGDGCWKGKNWHCL